MALVESGGAQREYWRICCHWRGGAVGCWLRWGLGAWLLNPVFPTLPLGTLAANLTGGLLMGLVMGLFDHFQTLPPALRLLVFTGFLGGLTTFSTFSGEATTLLLRQQYLWFSGHVLVARHRFAGHDHARAAAGPWLAATRIGGRTDEPDTTLQHGVHLTFYCHVRAQL